MSDTNKKPEIDVFSQLEDALEEREGSDRRKKDIGSDPEGNNRRKGDRRQVSPPA